jgi:hypothetical protein
LIASARGASRVEALEYALNWLPTLLLSLPARATADAVLAIFTGWTPAMGIMLVLWAAGSLVLARHLMRHSREIVDLIATGVQLGASDWSDESGEIPFAVRRLLERSSRPDDAGFRTPAWLERWQPTGIKALLWRDLLLTFRKTPAWLVILSPIGFILMVAGILLGSKHLVQVDSRIIVFVINFIMLILSPMTRDESWWRKPAAYFDLTRSLPFSAEQYLLYRVTAAMLEMGLWFLLPVNTIGLLIYPQVWYWWVGSLILMASYTLSAVLLGLVGELLTAQPYLAPVEDIWGAIQRSVIVLVLLIVGVGVYWLALGLGIWFPLFALLIGLISLPAQLYLLQQAVELWRNYTPLT